MESVGRISCIIPTLDRGEVLLETIRQLLNQVHRAHDIIVVDQTRIVSAATESALRSLHSSKAIHWLHQNEANASKARNAGAVAAAGDILLFLDDDINIQPDFIAQHAASYSDGNVVAVAGQVLEATGVVSDIPRKASVTQLELIRFPKNYAYRCTTSWMAAGNFSVRRSIYFDVGGMDENYVRGAFREESDFAMRFLNAGYQFLFNPEASILHLGVRKVPGGGARTWSNPLQWHHCIGDWYFNLKYARGFAAVPLIWYSFRHLVTSRHNLHRPWLVLVSAACWILSLPIALALRLRGPKLVEPTREALT